MKRFIGLLLCLGLIEKVAELNERCIPFLGYLPYDWERND